MRPIFPRKFLLLALTAAAALCSCTEDELDRINRNQSNPPASSVDARFQVTDAITATTFSILNGGYSWYAASYTEQMFGDGNNLLMYAELRDPVATAAATSFNNEWNATYRNLQNLRQILEKCAPGGLNDGQPDIAGIAETLKAICAHTLTMLHGDVPYSEALNASIKTPKLDPQSAIYSDILATLDSAISHLSAAAGQGMNHCGAQDILFGGDPSKWLGLAYAEKAKVLLDGMVRFPGCLPQVEAMARKALDEGFDGATLTVFNGLNLINSWAAFFRSRSYLGSNATLASLLEQRRDPRYAAYAHDTFGSGTLYASAGDAAMAVTTQQVGAPAWLSAQGAPLHILSKPELLFILAEARMRQGSDASGDMAEAMRRSVADWQTACAGVTDIASADLEIPQCTLKEILVQKYIALALDATIAAYNDLRRCKAMGETFVAMRNPCNRLSDGRSMWPLRFPYGNSDVVCNPNVAAAFGSGEEGGGYVLSEPIWLFGGKR